MHTRIETITLTQGTTRPLPVRGGSAVAAVPGRLFIAEDDEGIYRVQGGRAALWAGRRVHRALGDLEGLALNASGTVLWAVAEESGEVIALPVGAGGRTARSLGRLARPGQRSNKGFEGLTFLPARHSPNGRVSLAAVHEGKPRRVSIFVLPTLEQTHEFKLPKPAKRELADLADLTVDPVTGALLLLSEESRRIGVSAIDGDRLSLHNLVDIRVRHGERPEGLDFVTASRLVVVTESPARLIEFRVTRA